MSTDHAELTAARDKAHAQMMAAWTYWVEAKADFSIAAGELALAEYGQPESCQSQHRERRCEKDAGHEGHHACRNWVWDERISL